ncbi:unnamed protein product, partial [Prorocentrum cordatum]
NHFVSLALNQTSCFNVAARLVGYIGEPVSGTEWNPLFITARVRTSTRTARAHTRTVLTARLDARAYTHACSSDATVTTITDDTAAGLVRNELATSCGDVRSTDNPGTNHAKARPADRLRAGSKE